MSIVRMKKVLLAGPLQAREDSVTRLEKLGVVHVQDLAEQVAEPPAELVAEAARAARVVDTLKKVLKDMPEKPEPRDDRDPADLLATYDQVMLKKGQWEQELAALEKELRTVSPWGDFDLRDVRKLEDAGVFLRLYQTSTREWEKADRSFLKEAFWHRRVVLTGARDCGIIAFFEGSPPEEVPFERVSLPQRSVSELTRASERIRDDLEKADRRLVELAAFLPVFEKYAAGAQSRLARARVFAGLLEDGPVFASCGFVPEKRAAEVQNAFSGSSTVVILEDPGLEDDIPIELDNHPVIRPFESLIRMFNLPNYREPDPTIMVAPFMGVFFGLCLGDGAYGLLLLVLGTYLAYQFREKRAILPMMRLLQILGGFTLIIGLMQGLVFGVQLPTLRIFSGLRGFFPLYTLVEKPEEMFYMSLRIGVVQLMIGFIIKFILSLIRKEFQTVIATTGWMLLLVFGYQWIGNGMTWVKFKEVWPLLASGGPMLFFFSNPSPSLGKRLGGGAWAMYNIAGLFGDVMSYARIFGLGMSSGIIAVVVNQMSFTMMGPRPGLGWIFGPVLLVFGHTFNFAMAIIGSLVHSARLNFLEYYGKFFDGGGKPYAPFGEQG